MLTQHLVITSYQILFLDLLPPQLRVCVQWEVAWIGHQYHMIHAIQKYLLPPAKRQHVQKHTELVVQSASALNCNKLF